MHQSYPDSLPFSSAQAFFAQFECAPLSSIIRRGVLRAKVCRNVCALVLAGTNPRAAPPRTTISSIWRMADVVRVPPFWLRQREADRSCDGNHGQAAATALTVGSQPKRGTRDSASAALAEALSGTVRALLPLPDRIVARPLRSPNSMSASVS